MVQNLSVELTGTSHPQQTPSLERSVRGMMLLVSVPNTLINCHLYCLVFQFAVKSIVKDDKEEEEVEVKK